MKAYKFCMRALCISIIASLQLLGLSQEATASIIVQLDSVAPDLVFPGNYRWTFSAIASSTDGFGSSVDNYFTIYDLPGSITTVEASAVYWGSASSALTGVTPVGLTPTDDPSKPNVTFRYTDSSDRPGNAAFQAGDHFDIILSDGIPIDLQYSWQDYSAYPIVNNPLQSGLGTVQNNVPEPATIGLIGLGLAGLGISRRKRLS